MYYYGSVIDHLGPSAFNKLTDYLLWSKYLSQCSALPPSTVSAPYSQGVRYNHIRPL